MIKILVNTIDKHPTLLLSPSKCLICYDLKFSHNHLRHLYIYPKVIFQPTPLYDF